MKKIILFELNEVPFKVVEEFCRWRPDSALARILPRCAQYQTYAADRGNLSPWTTWPTVHRGVSNERHFIQDFGQDLTEIDRECPPVWALLTAAGVRVGLCGSFHSYPMPANLEHYDFYLPDTFAAGAECFPDALSTFQEFNLKMVRESARVVSDRLPWQDGLRLLARASDLGFKPRTVASIVGQVVSERIESWRKTRRRTLQSELAFDIFIHYLDKSRPAFSTFFSNHVAASMHRYWAATFPDDYEVIEYDDEWMKTYRHEIEWTMRKADSFFSRLVSFADRNPEYVVWLTTSMGQAATVARPLETQLYVVDMPQFMMALGFQPMDWSPRPAMLPQVNLVVTPGKVEEFRRILSTFFIKNMPLVFRESDNGFFSIDLGHANLYLEREAVVVNSREIAFREMGLQNVEIDDKSGMCAYHVPQGCLIIYSPTKHDSKPRVDISTLDLAPAILQNFAVPVPEYMSRPVTLG